MPHLPEATPLQISSPPGSTRNTEWARWETADGLRRWSKSTGGTLCFLPELWKRQGQRIIQSGSTQTAHSEYGEENIKLNNTVSRSHNIPAFLGHCKECRLNVSMSQTVMFWCSTGSQNQKLPIPNDPLKNFSLEVEVKMAFASFQPLIKVFYWFWLRPLTLL